MRVAYIKLRVEFVLILMLINLLNKIPNLYQNQLNMLQENQKRLIQNNKY